MHAPLPSALAPAQLRWTIPASDLDFAATDAVEPVDGLVGQAPALDALAHAVHMRAHGYNVFVAGLDGGARLQTVARLIRAQRPAPRVRRDLCYLLRFEDPSRPLLVELPAGRAATLKARLLQLRAALHDQIPKALEADALRARRQATLDALEEGEGGLLRALQRQMESEGFALVELEDDPDPAVVFQTEGGPVRRAELLLRQPDDTIGERTVARVLERFRAFEDAVGATLTKVRAAARATSKAVDALDRGAVRDALRPLLKPLRRAFPEVRAWLGALEEAITAHHDVFVQGAEPEPEAAILQIAFTVQVMVKAASDQAAPVVVAADPTFVALFGGVVTDGLQGQPPDHTRLRGGLLHDADGGFLVLDCGDAAAEPGVWKTLVRSMRFGEIGVQNLDVATQGACAALRPDPLPLDVKVVLVGPMGLYVALWEGDEDFASVVKVLAEFSPEVDYVPGLPRALAGVLLRIGTRDQLRPLDAGGLAAVVEDAARSAGVGGKVRLDVGRLADIVREADLHARGRCVDRAAVQQALRARAARAGRAQAELHAELLRGSTRVHTEGTAVGQVNGLSVLQVGDHRFGRPLRITATAGAGRGRGVLNIERESGLSGNSFDKGIAVLQGWMIQTFGRSRSLDVRASICVEQSYGPIDGDSATLAELLALLSSIGEIPLRQGIAVTGSLDQHGVVQPVGGVTEKVEGFFALCRDRGLQAGQGVIIPADNVRDLMLDDEVVEAAASGRFAIWPVQRVEHALALIMDGDLARASLSALDAAVARLCAAARPGRGGLRASGLGLALPR